MTTGSPDPDRVAALAALYQAERQDLTGILAQSIALVGLSLTYMAILGALVSSDTFQLGPVALGWISGPVWMLIAFHALLLALTMAHGQSVAIIERRLVDTAGLEASAGAIGAAAGTGVTDLPILARKIKRWGLFFSTWIAYGGYFSIALAFTIFSLRAAWTTQVEQGTSHTLGFWIPLGLYVFCALAELASVIYIFGFMDEDLKGSARPDVS